MKTRRPRDRGRAMRRPVAGPKLRPERLERRNLLTVAAPVEFGAEGEAGLAALPDFVLVDVNPASPRHQQGVSPRDYLEQVSGWYFGHAG